MAEELGNFTSRVGGPEYVHYLLPPLENLASIEEAAVREKAVESLQKLAGEHSIEAIQRYFVPMVLRLAMGRWSSCLGYLTVCSKLCVRVSGSWSNSRFSSCGLFTVAYIRANEQLRTELRK